MDQRDTHTVMKSGLPVSAVGLTLASPALEVVGCCLLMSVAAQVRVPVPGTDVPMTLQALAMLVTGLAMAPRRAAASMMLYLLCGTLGLPVFAPGSVGILGPTGGYIVGFAVAAWMVSLVKGQDRPSFARLLGASAIGMTALFIVGVSWRIVWLGGDLRLAVATGLLPFAAKAVVEAILATTLVVSIRGWRGNRDR